MKKMKQSKFKLKKGGYHLQRLIYCWVLIELTCNNLDWGGGGGKKCNNVDAYEGYLVLQFTITKLRNTFSCSVVLDEAQDQIILTCSVLPLSYIQVHSFSAPVVAFTIHLVSWSSVLHQKCRM